MGRQSVCWLDADDLGEIFDVVAEFGGSVIDASTSESPAVMRLDRAGLVAGGSALLVPDERVNEVRRTPSTSGRFYWINGGPGVELLAPHAREIDGRLAIPRGRFYYDRYSYGRAGAVEAKPEEVTVFADRVFKWARRWMVRVNGKYVGPNAARAAREGRVALHGLS